MNPMAVEAIGAIVRAGLMVLAGYIVKAGIWNAGQAEVYVGAASLGLITLGWSLWQKYRSRLKLLTALTQQPGTTEAVLEMKMAAGVTPTVLVSTPKVDQP